MERAGGEIGAGTRTGVQHAIAIHVATAFILIVTVLVRAFHRRGGSRHRPLRILGQGTRHRQERRRRATGHHHPEHQSLSHTGALREAVSQSSVVRHPTLRHGANHYIFAATKKGGRGASLFWNTAATARHPRIVAAVPFFPSCVPGASPGAPASWPCAPPSFRRAWRAARR